MASTWVHPAGLPSLRERAAKPYYVFRPRQLAERLRGTGDEVSDDGLATARLPWGWTLRFPAWEQTGVAIRRRGLFDITVSEVLWRLTDHGDVAVDVGANVGHMTSVLARRLAGSGVVHAFEPHPDVHALLDANVDSWRSLGASIRTHTLALSDAPGSAALAMDDHWSWNRGSATLSPGRPDVGASLEVSCVRLDDLFDGPIGVVKIDVEGHEEAVLRGASSLLRRGLVRDIVFEDWAPPPTSTAQMLESYGYAILSLDHSLFGPITAPGNEQAARRSHDDPSYLATRDPQRACARLRPRGWCVLGQQRIVGLTADRRR